MRRGQRPAGMRLGPRQGCDIPCANFANNPDLPRSRASHAHSPHAIGHWRSRSAPAKVERRHAAHRAAGTPSSQVPPMNGCPRFTAGTSGKASLLAPPCPVRGAISPAAARVALVAAGNSPIFDTFLPSAARDRAKRAATPGKFGAKLGAKARTKSGACTCLSSASPWTAAHPFAGAAETGGAATLCLAPLPARSDHNGGDGQVGGRPGVAHAAGRLLRTTRHL